MSNITPVENNNELDDFLKTLEENAEKLKSIPSSQSDIPTMSVEEYASATGETIDPMADLKAKIDVRLQEARPEPLDLAECENISIINQAVLDKQLMEEEENEKFLKHKFRKELKEEKENQKKCSLDAQEQQENKLEEQKRELEKVKQKAADNLEDNPAYKLARLARAGVKLIINK